MATRAAATRELPEIRENLWSLSGRKDDYDNLMSGISNDVRIVMLGEASHGTHEFYEERIKITKRLIVEKGFTMVVAEADWPDALEVHKYALGAENFKGAEEALGGFKRFPTWMWRNQDMLSFVEWMREYNQEKVGAVPGSPKAAGFFGMDLYSLHKSIEAVMQYLENRNPPAAERAKKQYSCFDQFGVDPQVYGLATSLGVAKNCEDEAVRVLRELQSKAADFIRDSKDHDPRWASDEQFYAEQNALVVKDAEAYYRSMFDEAAISWNMRDRHMVRCVEALLEYSEQKGASSKAVIWAHNSHLGDARATHKGSKWEINVGQLLREKYGSRAVNIGFSTHSGWVTAASEWGGRADRKRVRPGLRGSYEELFHQIQVPRFLLDTTKVDLTPRLQRAIGVIYRPDTERLSHYLQADLNRQFDYLIHFDETTAVHPLEKDSVWDRGELPETFPFGQ